MKFTYFLISFAVIFTISCAGCVTNALSPQSPSSLTLQPSDIPGNYNVTLHTNLTQIRDSWKNDYLGGFYIEFTPLTKGGNITGISQTIISFRTNNLSEIYNASRDSLESITDRNVTHLANITIGDRSDAYKITDTTGLYDHIDYVILFSRNGVLEQVEMYGPNPDYEEIKNLTGLAAQKIKG